MKSFKEGRGRQSKYSMRGSGAGHTAQRLKISSWEKCLSTCLLPPPPPHVLHVGNVLLAGRKVNVRQGYFNIYSRCVGPRLRVLSCPSVSQSTYIPRVPQCQCPRPNWGPHPLSLKRDRPPPPPPGCGQTRLRVRGSGGPNSDD